MNARESPASRYDASREFLFKEAYTLDNKEYQEWIDDFLAEEVSYRVPTRTTQEKETRSEFSRDSFHFNEDRDSLAVKVNRLENEYAWSANPPSRIRRLVSNIMVERQNERLVTTDYLVVIRHDRDDRMPQLLSAERVSELEVTDHGLRLSKRNVFIDQTAISFDHLPLL